jgi:O-acetyl-ADP-ribose deacetylase (regulator of RNase III)
MEIVTQQGDIAQVKADAVVNPANSQGAMGGGLGGALKRLGGEVIEEEAMKQAPIPIGEAVATSAGSLPFRYVVHAPTMAAPGERSTVEAVRQATLAARMCGDSYGVKVLAMPGLGAGVGGLSPASAAEVIVETLRNYETASIRKVILIDQEADMARAFRDALFAERG